MALKKNKNKAINQICRSCKDCKYLVNKDTHFECLDKESARISQQDLGCEQWVEKQEVSVITKLDKKEERFAQEYMIDLNGKQAAIRCGYSEVGAHVQGSRMLSNPNVQHQISLLRQTAKENLGTSHQQMLSELRNFAYSDITQTMCMSMEQIKELPADIRRMVVSYKSKTRLLQSKTDETGQTVQMIEETFELKFVDKTKVIEMIGKHTGFFDVDNTPKNQTIIVKRPTRD